MKFDIASIITKLPAIIKLAVTIADKIKAPGSDKKSVVIAAIPDALAAVEVVVDKDLFNDPEIAKLVSAVVDAEAAVKKATDALKAGLLNKQTPVTPAGSVVSILD